MDQGWGRFFKPRADLPRSLYTALSVASFAVLLAAWSAVTYGGLVDPLFLPTPAKIVADGWTLLVDLHYATDIFYTVFRVLAGFCLSAIIGVPLGILVGTFRPVEAMLAPLASFIRYMPASAFIPLFILWIGLGEWEKVAIIFVGSFFSLLLMTAVNTATVPRDLMEVSYTLGVRPRNVVWRVLLPAAAPAILDTLSVILGWAWTYIIVAELVAAEKGIGHRILESQRQLRTGYIIFGILVIGVIGLISDLSLRWLRRKLFAWVE